MEMNLNNTSESYDPGETLPHDTLVGEPYTCENSSCDTECVCDSRSLKKGEIKETAFKEKITMCQHTNQQIEQTVDSSPNQNWDTDLHHREERKDEMTTKLCLSEGNVLSVQNGEKDDKNIHSVPLTDCNTLTESTDAAPMEICEHSNIADSRRTRRSSKRKRDIEDFCPVCGVTVRYSELATHFAKEVENLSKISKSIKKTRSEGNDGVSTTFVQVKTNRENRHAAKVAKFSTRSRNEICCPVCNVRLTGTQEEINNHVLNCINEDENNEEINIIDSDDEDGFEEYEFADQTRVRAISMVPGGYRTLQGDSSKPRSNDDEDLNVDVDVDDTLAYGSPQYTELDVIHNNTDCREKEELEQLRKAVLIDPSAERHILESRKWINNCDGQVNSLDSSFSLDKIKTVAESSHEASKEHKSENQDQENCRNEADDHIVSSLKEKIKDLEEQNKSVKCLICLEPYTKPVVSTTCWHVHCEECWLMTMGVKKLCPQCNMIVFPSDLRRIYL